MQVDGLPMIVVIAGVLILALPISLIILFLRTSSLQNRISRLERRLNALDQPSPQPRVETPPVVAAIPEPVKPAAETSLSAWDAAVGRKTAEETATVDQPTPEPAEKTAPLAARTNQPIVMRPDRMDQLFDWLRTNWIYAVSATSLGLAGIFFVQYGVERGLLPPALRVIAAILFGAALIGAGEWIRRRHGDEGPTSTIHLPSVFSAAGLVSIFAATLAARHLYGLISSEVAFAGHLFTAALAILLGWFYGPLLAAVGLIGAALSPFIVAGGSGPAPWLYAYFALITATGLGIDAVRRWAWVSVLALVLGYAASFVVFAVGAGEVGWLIVMLALAILAVVVPPLSLTPRHPAPFTLQTVLGQSAGTWPDFAVRLAAGAALASSIGMLLTGNIATPILVPLALTALALAYLIWAHEADGLADLALLPTLGLLLRIVIAPETGTTTELTMLVAMATAISFVAAWRALQKGQGLLRDMGFGLMAVLTAPVAVATLELLAQPALTIGAIPWAFHIIAVAALATTLATRFAAADQGDMRRTAHAMLASLSLIALALFVVTTATALTLALAVLLVVAAALDRRFNLREMGLFIQIGAAVLTFRLLLDPGLEFALDGPILQVILAFAGSIAALLAARWLIIPRTRDLTMAVLESAAAGLIAIFANILITRWLIPELQAGMEVSYWQTTLSALPWMILMLTQLYRAQASTSFRNLRLGLAALAAAIAGVFLLVAVFLQNPLYAYGPEDLSMLVRGPVIFDTLWLAYAIPGIILLAGRWQMPQMGAGLRMTLLAVGTALLVIYTGLEIRRLWKGPYLGGSGLDQGELYSYTVAMMLAGAGLLFQAMRKGSPLMRRIAMGVIGLTIAKVFLIDAAGLTGLTRVFSFLALGLSLAGLAWLNRWAGQVTEKSG
jgi:uncharacterized membrane protein